MTTRVPGLPEALGAADWALASERQTGKARAFLPWPAPQPVCSRNLNFAIEKRAASAGCACAGGVFCSRTCRSCRSCRAAGDGRLAARAATVRWQTASRLSQRESAPGIGPGGWPIRLAGQLWKPDELNPRLDLLLPQRQISGLKANGTKGCRTVCRWTWRLTVPVSAPGWTVVAGPPELPAPCRSVPWHSLHLCLCRHCCGVRAWPRRLPGRP